MSLNCTAQNLTTNMHGHCSMFSVAPISIWTSQNRAQTAVYTVSPLVVSHKHDGKPLQFHGLSRLNSFIQCVYTHLRRQSSQQTTSSCYFDNRAWIRVKQTRDRWIDRYTPLYCAQRPLSRSMWSSLRLAPITENTITYMIIMLLNSMNNITLAHA